nr:PEP-CTERM sorting domain-containing protein [uncultured Desulfobacter sp.]
MKKIQLLIVLVISILGSCNCFAVTYNENVSGDLAWLGNDSAGHGSYTDIGTLDIGANTISGHFFFDSAADDRYDFDPFVFTIAPGMKLSSIFIEYSTTYLCCTGPATNDAAVNFNLMSPVSELFYTLLNLLGEGSMEVFPNFYSVEAGSYFFSHSGIGGTAWESNYTFTFITTSSTVPVPATLSLLTIGLLGLAGLGRRK